MVENNQKKNINKDVSREPIGVSIWNLIINFLKEHIFGSFADIVIKAVIVLYWTCIVIILPLYIFSELIGLILSTQYGNIDADKMSYSFLYKFWVSTHDLRLVLILISLFYIFNCSIVFFIYWVIYIIFGSLGFLLNWIPSVLVPFYDTIGNQGIYDLFNTLFSNEDIGVKFDEIWKFSPFSSDKISKTTGGEQFVTTTRDNVSGFYNTVNQFIKLKDIATTGIQNTIDNTEVNYVDEKQVSQSSKTSFESYEYDKKFKSTLDQYISMLLNVLDVFAELSDEFQTIVEEKTEEVSETAEIKVEENT